MSHSIPDDDSLLLIGLDAEGARLAGFDTWREYQLAKSAALARRQRDELAICLAKILAAWDDDPRYAHHAITTAKGVIRWMKPNTGSMNAVFGKWPGDETDEDIAKALGDDK